MMVHLGANLILHTAPVLFALSFPLIMCFNNLVILMGILLILKWKKPSWPSCIFVM